MKKRTWMKYIAGCLTLALFDPNGNSKRDSDCNSYSESGII